MMSSVFIIYKSAYIFCLSSSYLLEHDKTKYYDFHTDGVHLPPAWTKISDSAWDARSKLTGGYGRKVEVILMQTRPFCSIHP